MKEVYDDLLLIKLKFSSSKSRQFSFNDTIREMITIVRRVTK